MLSPITAAYRVARKIIQFLMAHITYLQVLISRLDSRTLRFVNVLGFLVFIVITLKRMLAI